MSDAPEKGSNHTIEFQCPFCGGLVSAGAPPDSHPYIVHAVPTCVRFDSLEPDEYMAAANDRVRLMTAPRRGGGQVPS